MGHVAQFRTVARFSFFFSFFSFDAQTHQAHHGSWKAAPPKTCVRMATKLADDHANERAPKSAANIDMSRAALTFREFADLVKCYDACEAVGLHVVRAKNNFDPLFDAARETFG